MDILSVNQAIKTLTDARVKCAGASSFGWQTVNHAIQYLDKQVDSYFAQMLTPEEVDTLVAELSGN